MRRNAATKWAIVALAVCLLAIVGIFLGKQLADRREAARIQAEVDQIVALVTLPKNHQERFDAVRAFLQEHSVHRIDQEFRALSEEKGFTTAVLAHAKGEREAPVPMECATRTNLMSKMLSKLGYKTRTVAIFDSETERSHTFLEVQNPDSGRWETQDADYNIYWRDPRTNERVSAAERSSEVSALEPCRVDCGWDALPKANKLRTYFDTIVIKDRLAGTEEVRRNPPNGQ